MSFHGPARIQSPIYHAPKVGPAKTAARNGPSKALTPNQQRILQWVTEYVREIGYGPSIREIGEAMQLRSSSTVHSHLVRLERKGYITRNRSKARSIQVHSLNGLPSGGPMQALVDCVRSVLEEPSDWQARLRNALQAVEEAV